MPFSIRSYESKDLAALYDICLKTADSGKDASHLYQDPKLIGQIYAAPYAIFDRQLCFVLEDEKGVCGYVLGALDSALFYKWFKEEWLKEVLLDYERPQEGKDLNRDELLIAQLFDFDEKRDAALFEAYPSHLHIDLLSRAQRQGYGKQLIESLLQALRNKQSKGVHLGLGANNHNAFAFYKHVGFKELRRSKDGINMGLSLD